MDEQMFCFQCEQAAGCRLHRRSGVRASRPRQPPHRDRLTGALIAFAGQLIAAGRGPACGTGPAADAGAVHHHYQREL